MKHLLFCLTILLSACFSVEHENQQESEGLVLNSVIGENDRTVLSRVSSDLCDKEIVLLGEGASHGEGRTVEFKAALVANLVETCGFNTVLVEAGIYDLLAYHSPNLEYDKSRAHLANAIGGVWANADQAQDWITYLHDAALSGKITVGGLDDQLSATAFYAQEKLAGDLAQYLELDRRRECEAVLFGHINWTYNSDRPYSADVEVEIDRCLQQIEEAIQNRNDASLPDTAQHSVMARNLRNSVSRGSIRNRTESFNIRDRNMFQNLLWHRSQVPAESKVLVWCSSIHAAKTLAFDSNEEVRKPLGAYLVEEFGSQLSSIGFSAYSGAYWDMPSQNERNLDDAPIGSLESRAAQLNQHTVYYDNQALRELGTLSARALVPRFQDLPWHLVLDGIIVFDEQESYRIR